MVQKMLNPKHHHPAILAKPVTSDREKTYFWYLSKCWSSPSTIPILVPLFFLNYTEAVLDSQVALVVKNLPAVQKIFKRCGLNPWGRKIPWRRAWQPTPGFLSGEPHGQRSFMGQSVGLQRVDMTE